MLNELRMKNPGLRLYSVLDPEFRRYGRVLDMDTGELAAALEETAIPESGNAYEASVEILEKVGLMPKLKRRCFGEMEIEAGFCNGKGFQLLQGGRGEAVFTSRSLL